MCNLALLSQREQTGILLDRVRLELLGHELQLLQNFLLGLKHGLEGFPLPLMLSLLAQGLLLQKQISSLSLLTGELCLRPLSRFVKNLTGIIKLSVGISSWLTFSSCPSSISNGPLQLGLF